MTASGKHPAWSEPTDSFRAVEGTEQGAVGHTQLYVGTPAPPFGLRLVIVSELVAITPELSRTTMTITPTWEYTEGLSLRDTTDGHTHVTITGWITTTPITDAQMHQMSRNFTRIVQGYVQRAVDWRPGDPFKTNLITPEPKNVI